nr:hypothetical protein [Candidatus Anammoximicrobium sp.]
MQSRHQRGIAILLLTLMAGSSVGFVQAKSPFDDAVAVWQMKQLGGSADKGDELAAVGQMRIVALAGADREASLFRGGDGYAVRLEGGYLTTSSRKPIQLAGKQASICLRLRDPSGQWLGGLLASADSKDRLANLIYADGKELVYRWRTTPLWQRVEGMKEPTEENLRKAQRGTYGFNGESNDAHDLLEYPARQWICSVVRVHDDGRVVVTDASGQAERSIDIERQSISGEAFYVGSKVGTAEFLDGDIAEILFYSRPLTDEETKRLQRSLLAKWRLDATCESKNSAAPTDGLVLHLDAAQVKADENGKVAVWNDISGHSRDVKQPVADWMPQCVAGALGGMPAIRFRHGQYLQGPAVLAEGDDSFTIVALWRRDHLNGSQVICEQNAPGKQAGRRAALLAQGSSGPQYAGGNFNDGVLPVSAPLDWVGRDGWHDVIVRFADTIVELYVDGVLIDEEWPHGALYRFHSPFLIGAGYSAEGRLQTPFSGEIDHV